MERAAADRHCRRSGQCAGSRFGSTQNAGIAIEPIVGDIGLIGAAVEIGTVPISESSAKYLSNAFENERATSSYAHKAARVCFRAVVSGGSTGLPFGWRYSCRLYFDQHL